MILAEKIQSLRKKNGWSQEDLAEKLNVSRQSVSKWESAASIPDINKILELAKLFGVTTDYLLKDSMEQTEYTETTEDEAQNRRFVSLPEANDFLKSKAEEGRLVGLGALLCTFSPVPLIFLSGLAMPEPPWANGVTESAAEGVGVTVLLLIVAAGIVLFLYAGARAKRFDPLKTEEFELEYGVEGAVREKRLAFEKGRTAKTAAGIALCILSPVPVIAAGVSGSSDAADTMLTALLLALVAAAVYLFASSGTEKSGFDLLLREGDFEGMNTESRRRIDRFAGIYWPAVTAAYLGCSFLSRRWDSTWLIWPVAALAFSAVCAALKKQK